GDLCPRTQVSQPIPREDTCDRHDDIVTIGGDDLQESCGGGCGVLVHQALPVMVQEAEGHRPGMQIDATVRFVLFGGESPEVSSSSASAFSHSQHTTGVC